MFKFIKNLSIKSKIILILVFPFSGFLVTSGQNLISNYQDMNSYQAIYQLSTLSEKISSLVHELQKERGASAGYLGSKGKKFNARLDSQRKSTDQSLKNFQGYLENFKLGSFDPELREKLDDADLFLSKLANKRREISDLRMLAKDAVDYYTDTNKYLLGIIGLMSHLSSDAEISSHISAYFNFLQSKERAGIERAVMSNAFSRGGFTASWFVRFIDLVSKQEAFLSVFKVMATPEEQELYKKTVRGPAVDEVERMRKTALDVNLDTSRSFNVDAEYWFETISSKINLLKEVENHLSSGIQERTEQLAKSMRSTMIFIGRGI